MLDWLDFVQLNFLLKKLIYAAGFVALMEAMGNLLTDFGWKNAAKLASLH
jgi:hypothetical protein